MSPRAQWASTWLSGLRPQPLLRPSVGNSGSIPLGLAGEPSVASAPKVRTRIWEFHNSLHCSVIGTCLTTAELRQVLLRLNVRGAAAASDHSLHQTAVTLAGSVDAGAKHLQKALDRRHRTALNQFAKAKDEPALAALWDDAVKRGDIPGAYWAVLTHPAATAQIVKQAFGEVHMLSHLVGAANRADIRRLRQLEADNAALAATLERQQRQLRDGFTSRDDAIRRLSDILARRADEDTTAVAKSEDVTTLTEALAERERRLADETSRRQKLESRLAKSAADREEAKRARELAERERDTLHAELASLGRQIESLFETEEHPTGEALDLHGRYVLYVGGRVHQLPRLKELVEQRNGRFIHHDGGVEHNGALLPGLVSRADIVCFPVDCVSHPATAAIKRTCRQMGKRYLPLRTSSLACLLSGLGALEDPALAFEDAALV